MNGVGILLTAFGIFWGAEGSAELSARVVGDNWAVLGLIVRLPCSHLFWFKFSKRLEVQRPIAVGARTLT
jgi:uncharacterized membrane protein